MPVVQTGNHDCATVISNYISKLDIDYYTVIRGMETEPKLPLFFSDQLHAYLMMVSIHKAPTIHIWKRGSLIHSEYQNSNIIKIVESMSDFWCKLLHISTILIFEIYFRQMV